MQCGTNIVQSAPVSLGIYDWIWTLRAATCRAASTSTPLLSWQPFSWCDRRLGQWSSVCLGCLGFLCVSFWRWTVFFFVYLHFWLEWTSQHSICLFISYPAVLIRIFALRTSFYNAISPTLSSIHPFNRYNTHILTFTLVLWSSSERRSQKECEMDRCMFFFFFLKTDSAYEYNLTLNF